MVNVSPLLFPGNWYVKKCANKSGRCRSVCRATEKNQPSFQTCKGRKRCCVRIDADAPLTCDETKKPSEDTSESHGDADSYDEEDSHVPEGTVPADGETTTSTGAASSSAATTATVATTTTGG